jgi:hypothetical protein
MYVLREILELSLNLLCSGKTTKHFAFYHIFSQMKTFLEKRIIKREMSLVRLQRFSEVFLILRII